MMASSTREFYHPYQPYDIQSELMNAIYDCIAEGKIGIFESPTGILTSFILNLVRHILMKNYIRHCKYLAIILSPTSTFCAS